MSDDADLALSRRLAPPVHAVWAAWSSAGAVSRWFAPRPWRAEVTALELHPGGAFVTVLHGPGGERQENAGCILEAAPCSRLVFTTALGPGFRPAAPALPMTAEIAMTADGPGTLYAVRVLHASAADRDRHAAMGFEEGWGAAVDQLEEVAAGFL
ncbi:SRPBCC domain-containing protein [Rhodovulum sp. DZ06]|uniref:SRPBCC domain-containing protein n=1 Tax=Rhodovulum sp. DZ06 TaxID=3425126 RepID=UPI003D33D4B6